MNQAAKNITWAAVGLAVIGGAVGGYLYFKRNINLALNYCYKIVSASNFSIGKEKFKVTLGVKILNRSEIAATILGYSFDIYLNKIRLGKVFSDNKQKIDAKGSSILSINVDVSSVGKITPADIIDIGLNYLNKNNWDKIIIQVKGNLKANVKVLGINVSLPVPIDISMSLKEIMTDDPNAMKCPDNF